MAVKPLTGRQVDDRPVATDGAARNRRPARPPPLAKNQPGLRGRSIALHPGVTLAWSRLVT